MKASTSPRAVGFCLVVSCAFFHGVAPAQDILVLSNGQSRETQVQEVKDARVYYRDKGSPAAASLPLNQIRSVTMEPPKAFDEALGRWRAGDAPGTLQDLEPLLKKFHGLPASWTIRASALLGQVLLETGDVSGAEKAFADFQATYPDARGLAEIGLARLAIEKGDLAGAAEKLRPLVEAAQKTLLAESGKSAEYGQALYLMGRVLEGQGKYSEALENYLLTATVFYEDPAVATRARERATALEKEKNVTTP